MDVVLKEILYKINNNPKINSDNIEDYFPTIELLGEGSECEAYGYGDYCLKYYGNYTEAERQARLWKNCGDSPLFPKIYAIARGWLIMEKIKGVLIEDILWDTTRVVEVVNQLKKFTKEQVDKGIIPYDLHPENVMLDENNNIKIIDVGYFQSLKNEEGITIDGVIRQSNRRLNSWYRVKEYYFQHGEPEYAKTNEKVSTYVSYSYTSYGYSPSSYDDLYAYDSSWESSSTTYDDCSSYN